MENRDGVFRLLQEREIKKGRCKFIYQVHLLPQLMKEISNSGSVTLPAGVEETLEALITDDQKLQCRGKGVKSVGYDAHYLPFNLTLEYEDNAYKLAIPWSDLLERNDISDYAVISIWVRQSSEAPLFYLRLDGYASEDDPLPPIPNMDEWKESNAAIH